MAKRQLISNRLNINSGIMSWYKKELEKMAVQMCRECTKVLADIYRELGYQTEFAADESISSQARIALNELYKKYSGKFFNIIIKKENIYFLLFLSFFGVHFKNPTYLLVA